ncbi:GNAT family N-acetyltransferase [Serratia ficaria]|uniref:GNAT family N-acetyltransferase n=1 Tax=Serratia ficaria TaxID=61651 RepID=UPI0039BC5818
MVCDGVIAAFSCISVLYPSPRFGGQMFIKELFVSAPFRRTGIGRKLMGFIASRAQEWGAFNSIGYLWQQIHWRRSFMSLSELRLSRVLTIIGFLVKR